MKLLRRLNFGESENRTENSRGNSKAGKTDNAFYDFRLNINYFGKSFRVGTRNAFTNTKKSGTRKNILFMSILKIVIHSVYFRNKTKMTKT
jgi:hypothetical protein